MIPLFVGDEADYSAPYLTVENGELVTIYPAKEHPGDPLIWIIPVLAILVIALLWFLRRRHATKSPPTD